MSGKRVLGYIFLLLAIVFSLAIVGQLPELFRALFGLFALFTGKLNSYQAGEVSGHLFYWLLHFAVTIALWIYGVGWGGKRVRA